MSTRVRVGDVEVRTDADLTPKQLRTLLRARGSLHMAVFPPTEETATNPNPVDFAAHVERAPEPEPESFFTDDEPE